MFRALGWATALLVLAPMAPASAAQTAAEGETVNLVMSNFRYCKAAPCTPADQGYLHSPQGGAIPGTDMAVVDVPAGSTVVWTYADSFCDAIPMCPGHMVMLEDGTPGGKTVGTMAKARTGAPTITWKVTGAPGTLIHYFCNVNDHWMYGMTGTLRVV